MVVPFDPQSIALSVLDNLLEGCQVIDRDGRYVYVNDSVARHAKSTRDALVGRAMTECFPGIDATPMFARVMQCMASRTHDRMENEFTYPDGSRGWFQLRFVPVPEGVCVLSLDVTETKRAADTIARAEAQLRHSQKMEAVGRLAGGVAHDFNNLLSVVLTNAELMARELAHDDPYRADLEEIRKAGERAAVLTRQLLAFSRQQVLEPRVVDFNEIIAGVEKMLRRLLGADIEVTLLLGADLWNTKVDPGQLEQVLVNLAVNARDAMPTGGKLTIETRNVVLDSEYAGSHIGVKPGEYAMLAVSDTGIGMDRETQARIFEPFFTTKEKGKGTGLGLATVFGIVQQSGGHIWVYSEPAAGTTFKVYFPHAAGRADADRPGETSGAPPRGSETILLVEDDDQVRAVARTVLRRCGFVVLEARNAGEALLICEEHTATIHLLLTDVVMPRMGGRALAERLRVVRAAMKVLFMSGYTDDAAYLHGILESGAAYLQKPITPEALARKVREVLDAR